MFPFKPVVVFKDIYFDSISAYIWNTDMVFGVVERRNECWANAVTTGSEAPDWAHLPVPAYMSAGHPNPIFLSNAE